MNRIQFIPFSALAGVLAGIIGKRTFERLWTVIDDGQTPGPKHRDVAWRKLTLALLLEGATIRAVRGLFDHGARRAFSRLTGTWPGEEGPDPA